MEKRITRQIAAMSEVEKQKLLDEHIGPLLPGNAPDPEDDERYLRNIVAGQLRDHDAAVEAAKSSVIAKLAERVAALERRVKAEADALMQAVGEAIAEAIRESGRHPGAWEPGRDYVRGNCVIENGVTWLAIGDAPAGSLPGRSVEWRMMAKDSDSK